MRPSFPKTTAETQHDPGLQDLMASDKEECYNGTANAGLLNKYGAF